jgi:hypothetical protein
VGRLLHWNPLAPSALASSVVNILSKLGSPIAGVIKRRWVKRQVRKAIASATSAFVAAHPETADALAGSAEPIAQELARLPGAGRPLTSNVLADHWVASGNFDPAEARRLAADYVQALHDALLKIDGFRQLFEAGASVTVAEIQQRAEEASRDLEQREAAIAYFEAAREYVHAAGARLNGDERGAWQSEYDARSLVDVAELRHQYRVSERLKDVRAWFRELVEDRYAEFKDEFESGGRAAAETALEALEQGSIEFRARVKESLL